MTGNQGRQAPIPRVQATLDLSAMSLTPEQYFVLSRVDGRSTVAEICMGSGLPEGRALDILRLLEASGAIEMDGSDSRAGPGCTRATAARTGRPLDRHRGPDRLPLLAIPEQELSRFAVLVSPADPELAEDVDLTLAQKRHILGLCRRLPDLSPYQILDIEPGADQAEIQLAYYATAKLVHPDRFFRRRLGSYQPRLAIVFRQVRQAFECLADEQRRGAYEQAMQEAARHRAEERQAARAAAQAAQAAQPSVPPTTVAAAGGRLARARQHFELGCQLAQDGSTTLAAAHLRLAVALDPGSDEYRARLQAVRGQLLGPEVASAVRRAELEAQVGRLEAAVRLYQRALERQPAAALYRRAAELLQRLGQLARAREYAMRATELAPDEVAARILLARIYRECGQAESARRELERALQLGPGDREAAAELAALGQG